MSKETNSIERNFQKSVIKYYKYILKHLNIRIKRDNAISSSFTIHDDDLPILKATIQVLESEGYICTLSGDQFVIKLSQKQIDSFIGVNNCNQGLFLRKRK